jgi:low temperature requirement protein LtrA
MIMHRTQLMSGRDPHEGHRSATPLELLFDLTFVVAFSIAGNEVAHLVAEGHFGSAIAAFGLAMFGVCWAWINFSWFASAYDTDDWIYRLLTMLQMVGVAVFSLGIPDMFKSVDAGGLFDGKVIVGGYVIMRLAMVAQWLRVAAHDQKRKSTALTYVATLLVAQAVWVVMAFALQLSVPIFYLAAIVPFAIELAGPYLAERKGGTPWHPHHIAERYGLLAIIALGEGVVGTIASVSSHIRDAGWSIDALLLCAAGIGLTFSMWWIYFSMPFGAFLHHHRTRSFFWGYGHIVLFSAIAATGAGLHVAGYYVEHKSHIGAVATLLSVAIPVAVYIACVFIIYERLTHKFDSLHKWQLLAAFLLAALAVGLCIAGVPLIYCLITLVLSPVAIVISYEWVGHQHIKAHLADGAHQKG